MDELLYLIIGALLVFTSQVVLYWIRRKGERKKQKNKICNGICDCIYSIFTVTKLYLAAINDYRYNQRLYDIESDIIHKDLVIEHLKHYNHNIKEFNSLNKYLYSLINDFYFYFEQNNDLKTLVQSTKELIILYPFEAYANLNIAESRLQYELNSKDLNEEIKTLLIDFTKINEFIRERQKELRETK